MREGKCVQSIKENIKQQRAKTRHVTCSREILRTVSRKETKKELLYPYHCTTTLHNKHNKSINWFSDMFHCCIRTSGGHCDISCTFNRDPFCRRLLKSLAPPAKNTARTVRHFSSILSNFTHAMADDSFAVPSFDSPQDEIEFWKRKYKEKAKELEELEGSCLLHFR